MVGWLLIGPYICVVRVKTAPAVWGTWWRLERQDWHGRGRTPQTGPDGSWVGPVSAVSRWLRPSEHDLEPDKKQASRESAVHGPA